jgi:hypothetical protein
VSAIFGTIFTARDKSQNYLDFLDLYVLYAFRAAKGVINSHLDEGKGEKERPKVTIDAFD